jgi:hypothetical protein
MTARRDIEAEVFARFQRDTANHQLELIKDDGLHRHLRFRKPGTGCYGFDIVTWPGHLAISGDMGGAMFTRLPDMFEFFRDDRQRLEADGLYINSGYWAEKCVANNGPLKEFDNRLFAEVVRDHFDTYMSEQDQDAEGFAAARDALWDHISAEVIEDGLEDTGLALRRMDDFEASVDNTATYGSLVEPERYEGWFKDFEFTDVWEYASSVEAYTFHVIWRFYAIAFAVKAYDSRSVSA